MQTRCRECTSVCMSQERCGDSVCHIPVVETGMEQTESPQTVSNTEHRPRRRDIAVTASLCVIVLIVLLLTGEISASVFAAGSLASCALALIYYLTAVTSVAPSTRSSQPLTKDPVSTEASETMMERLPIPVMMIGPGARIERANAAARAFLGLGAERGLLSTVLRQPRVLEAVSNALRGEKGGSVEYSTLAPLESHVRAFVEPIRLKATGPMPFRAMLVLADDTSSKRAERMRADFLANASHELRTPLASLSGFIDTLSGPARDDEEARARFLGIMGQQTERMRCLIDDLLSLSRVEMNEHLPPTEETDLNDIVTDVREALGPVTAKRAITLNVERSQGSARVIGDRHQVYQVVENLAENAIKYSADGSSICLCVYAGQPRDGAEHLEERLSETSGRLTLTGPALDSDARYGVVRVMDRGLGIERRFLPRLAERFFRVDGQKSGPTAGTGLGLAIVKHIVTRHRGGFTVESAPDHGSVFSVFFPMVRQKRNADASDSSPADQAAE